MNHADLPNGDGLSLSQMMDLQEGEGKLWDSADMGEIFKHQLATPLECDLPLPQQGLTESWAAAGGSRGKTFGDLLRSRKPPLVLLQLTKQFAKTCRNHPDSPLPDEIATVLYALSIAAALVRWDRRISRMDDQSLGYTFDWALKQPWLDESSRKLLEEARLAVDRSAGSPARSRSHRQEKAQAESPPQRIAGLIERIRESADKLASDRTSRGDLKILSRTLRELRYAFKVFAPYRTCRKVTVFGSARVTAEQPSYRQAVEFGRAMAQRDWLVVTGAAQGIMEAGHVGAGREHSMGLNILLPFEQEANPVIAGDHKLVHMKYFFTRKLMFVKETHAICLLPGGFGTLDEGLEVLTLLQTGKRDSIPVVFLDQPGGNYWKSLFDFIQQQMLARGFIDPSDLALCKLTDSVAEAVDEIIRFYRVYHSMRYVRTELVLRLTQRPSDALLEQLHNRFGDLLNRGQFTLSGPLPEERDEPELADLPRLVFSFNRRSFGRLRQLIDLLNETV